MLKTVNMKRILGLFLILTALFFSSCQKELYFDLGGIATGVLKTDSAGLECLPSTVYGTYQADSALGIGNYMDVQVDVSQVGSYTITSDTINGIYFIGTGTFGNAGLNTVRLYGAGVPQFEGITTFIITFGTSSCLVDVEILSGTTNANAVFTFGDAAGNCTGVNTSGTYMEGLAMNAANTARVDINVTSPGTYSITTPSVNGVQFTATGTLGLANTTVLLTATGTPLASGTFVYPVTGAGNSCSFSVTYATAAPPAAYTLNGSPNNCSGAVLSGTYTSGVVLNVGNTATINVNVTALGSYSITTPQINGFSFNSTNVFTTLGLQTVTLFATGTPTTSGGFNFPVQGAGSTCNLSVNVTGTPTDFITCKIDGQFTTFNIGASAGLTGGAGSTLLSIDGDAASIGVPPSISLQIAKASGGSVTPGAYTVNQALAGIGLLALYDDAAGVTFTALTDPTNQSQNPAFTITITSISATRCVGTFEGPVKDNNGVGPAIRNITEGIFNVPVQ
jgi:hypothetical protein